ncbi:hypothetical protein [Niallia circulans]|uniref:hypothetical protein n=1 Tax=Niallia circulans TaxID=1397 RepID=UPI00156040ED|nr:hypothetical protein [Niallia circulans]NRG30686.1 hypothetical protein [Niallia circulans]
MMKNLYKILIIFSLTIAIFIIADIKKSNVVEGEPYTQSNEESVFLDERESAAYENTILAFSKSQLTNYSSKVNKPYIDFTDNYIKELKKLDVNKSYLTKLYKIKSYIEKEKYEEVIELLEIPQPGDYDFTGPLKNK